MDTSGTVRAYRFCLGMTVGLSLLPVGSTTVLPRSNGHRLRRTLTLASALETPAKTSTTQSKALHELRKGDPVYLLTSLH